MPPVPHGPPCRQHPHPAGSTPQAAARTPTVPAHPQHRTAGTGAPQKTLLRLQRCRAPAGSADTPRTAPCAPRTAPCLGTASPTGTPRLHRPTQSVSPGRAPPAQLAPRLRQPLRPPPSWGPPCVRAPLLHQGVPRAVRPTPLLGVTGRAHTSAPCRRAACHAGDPCAVPGSHAPCQYAMSETHAPCRQPTHGSRAPSPSAPAGRMEVVAAGLAITRVCARSSRRWKLAGFRGIPSTAQGRNAARSGLPRQAAVPPAAEPGWAAWRGVSGAAAADRGCRGARQGVPALGGWQRDGGSCTGPGTA